MREQELLSALSLESPGIEMHMSVQNGQGCAWVGTLYEPTIQATGPTLFDAAFKVGQQMIAHPNCPAAVKVALEAYGRHSEMLQV
jgi:uncharacterized protein YfiM (DUF2279 family)